MYKDEKFNYYLYQYLHALCYGLVMFTWQDC